MSEIDVSKCYHLWWNNNNECVAYQDSCANRPDCYYRQLQQLKRENEKLKQGQIHFENKWAQAEDKLEKIKEYCRKQKLFNVTSYDISRIIESEV